MRKSVPVATAILMSCAQGSAMQTPASVQCAAGNGGITLPAGFCATVAADSVPGMRHIAVAPNGDVFVAVMNMRQQRGGVIAMRDTNGDGVFDVRERFGDNGGNGIALRGNALYFATNDAVLRYTVPAGQLRPTAGPDTIVKSLPANRSHTAKSIALGNGNELFVNIGSPSNSCQQTDRTNASPGVDPCTELDTRAGIWVFDANKTNQTQGDGRRFATGIRNAVAITFVPQRGLFALQHGRDQLAANWGEHFNTVESAEKPSELFMDVKDGDDYGWPYCYHDPQLNKQVLAPEYGGDGEQEGRCASVKEPAYAFPAHWAPNGVAAYTASQFPQKYRDGFFIAFHGSWNRAPEPQAGYNVAFLPYRGGQPAGPHEIFADGFVGANPAALPGGARYRPTAVTVAPDGSLYISADTGGRLWRVFYRG